MWFTLIRLLGNESVIQNLRSHLPPLMQNGRGSKGMPNGRGREEERRDERGGEVLIRQREGKREGKREEKTCSVPSGVRLGRAV